MAKLLIAEFSTIGRESPGTVAQAASLPPVAEQAVTFNTTTQSSALSATTTLVRVMSDADCFIVVGANPTAVVTGAMKLIAGQAEYFGVKPGDKIAAVTS